MNKLFLILISIYLIISGIFSILLYTNLLLVGYTFIDFVKFIIRDIYFFNLLFGLFILILCMKG
jgi:hypothetical protein